MSTLRRVAYGAAGLGRSWIELAAEAPLRRFGLIERTDGAGLVPAYRQTFCASQCVLSIAHGHWGIDPELTSIGAIGNTACCRLDDLIFDAAVGSRIATAVRDGDMVILCGPLGSGRRSLLSEIARASGHDVFVVDSPSLSPDRTILRRQLRAVMREARLLELTPLFRGFESFLPSDQQERLAIFEDEVSGLVLATSTRAPARRWKRQPVVIEMAELRATQRAEVWARSLPEATNQDTQILATMFPLTPALVMAASEAARKLAGDEAPEASHIEAGVGSVLDNQLSGLATRIRVEQSWKDFVLPAEQIASLVELLARIRRRSKVYEEWGFGSKLGKGLGVAALFSGPPGTGKTMAAGLIAAELRVPLYQIDLSKIVSKYIGETEKNLGAVFDAAEAGHAILLFDEADSIFGKRTEVKSSNDRYANQETNYLLQRLETFKGVCILTTNHDAGIDEAFRRRLSVHVKFPVPEVDERRNLWRALIPADAPLASGVTFDALAERFEMSGGYIRNAVLRAAFLAADRDVPIDSTLLLQAATTEYEAMGKVIASTTL
ncbi:MAG: ATP-binding protein [Deltaproteobacteria bacterium]|nr:ATP-binding protein [Deltaproteobacteria bacterium]